MLFFHDPNRPYSSHLRATCQAERLRLQAMEADAALVTRFLASSGGCGRCDEEVPKKVKKESQ